MEGKRDQEAMASLSSEGISRYEMLEATCAGLSEAYHLPPGKARCYGGCACVSGKGVSAAVGGGFHFTRVHLFRSLRSSNRCCSVEVLLLSAC